MCVSSQLDIRRYVGHLYYMYLFSLYNTNTRSSGKNVLRQAYRWRWRKVVLHTVSIIIKSYERLHTIGNVSVIIICVGENQMSVYSW